MLKLEIDSLFQRKVARYKLVFDVSLNSVKLILNKYVHAGNADCTKISTLNQHLSLKNAPKI